MSGRIAKRVIHMANLPIKLLMPTKFENITEISLKTICSASKIEIKNVLESLYGFEVEKVHTLNMEGKKKKRGGILLAKPDYKKAFVTLKYPLSISPDLFPIKVIRENKEELNKQRKTSILDAGGPKKSHWLEERRAGLKSIPHRPNKGTDRACAFPEKSPRRVNYGGGGRGVKETARFPWTSMRKNGADSTSR